MKVMTIVGTRPEIIRLCRVMQTLDDSLDHVIVHTGQNYDFELNQVFFDELGVRAPDHFLGIDTSSIGSVLGDTLIKIDKLLESERPDAVLILGDTNSAIAGIVVKRHKIPLYHMEAGNRCFDANVPEELNRKIIDRISDFNLVYTEHARRHLLSEGFPHRRIYLTGSPMREVLQHFASQIDESNILDTLKLKRGKFFIVSVHREENVDNSENLRKIVSILNTLAERYDFPVVVSTHPRTRKRLESLEDCHPDQRIQFLKPFGFFDYNKLQQDCACALSDSGTITEESSILGFPAVTVRSAMERPEGLDSGSIILTGLDVDTVTRSVHIAMKYSTESRRPPVPNDYLPDNVSERVLKLIVGTSHLSNAWDGVTLNDMTTR